MASVSACPNDACNYSGSNGISGVMDDWNGGAFASNLGAAGSLLVFGGGHSGYNGNEVYGFDVAQGTWSRLTNPVSPPICDFSTSTMAGNSPCVPHTYDYLEYSPITNEFVKLGSSADNETVAGHTLRACPQPANQAMAARRQNADLGRHDLRRWRGRGQRLGRRAQRTLVARRLAGVRDLGQRAAQVRPRDRHLDGIPRCKSRH